MKKIVRLKEKDLQRIVKRVLKEQVDELPNDDMDRAFPEDSEDNGFSQTTDKRYIRSNYGLTSLPDPTDMSPETAVINLNGNNITNLDGNNITNLDLTGYERFEGLFLLSLADNPIESINVQSVADVAENLSRILFTYIPTEENEERVSELSNYIDQMESGVMYEFTPYNEDND
jgi:hypothetical protein